VFLEDNLNITMQPIGTVHCARTTATDDDWDNIEADIALDERFASEALAGLEDFSHVEVVFCFDRVAEEKIETAARHPRGRRDWPKVGIFAQRGKNRPNRIGVTVCALLRVEGTRLRLRGLDAIDGTPVLDIKPVMTGFLPRGKLREPEWAVELMRNYW
jgi:tRNA (adenine37-N6)-methyltransferase